MKKFAFLVVALLAAACAGGPVGNKNVPQPLKAVDTEKYLGKWYEIGRYENRFELDCEAVTAEYSKRDDGKIKVLNSCRHGAVNGELETAEGKAEVVEGSKNAKLKVSFFWPFYGDYWVLDRADDYSWSIVGEPSGRYLWILMRDAKPSEKQKKALWKRAWELGYDVTMLRETAH